MANLVQVSASSCVENLVQASTSSSVENLVRVSTSSCAENLVQVAASSCAENLIQVSASSCAANLVQVSASSCAENLVQISTSSCVANEGNCLYNCVAPLILLYSTLSIMLPTLRHHPFIVDVFDSTGNIVAKEYSKSDIVDCGSDFFVNN